MQNAKFITMSMAQPKGQLISKQNCRAVTSPKNKRTNLFFYPDDQTTQKYFKLEIQVSGISESSE